VFSLARSSLALALTGLVFSGCPGYGETESCVRDSQCAPGYVCDVDAGSCVENPVELCAAPIDCADNETCSRDGSCEVGDCSWPDIGCVEGFICSAADGLWECVVDDGSNAGGASGSGGGGAGGSAGSPI